MNKSFDCERCTGVTTMLTHLANIPKDAPNREFLLKAQQINQMRKLSGASMLPYIDD